MTEHGSGWNQMDVGGSRGNKMEERGSRWKHMEKLVKGGEKNAKDGEHRQRCRTSAKVEKITKDGEHWQR